MLNQVNIMGRLTHNPGIKTTPNGKSVSTFSIATNQGSKEKEKTYFIDLVAWNSTAEFLCKYFSKGSLIIVSGILTSRTYTDKNENKRKATEILVNEIHFSGEKSKNANSNTIDDVMLPTED